MKKATRMVFVLALLISSCGNGEEEAVENPVTQQNTQDATEAAPVSTEPSQLLSESLHNDIDMPEADNVRLEVTGEVHEGPLSAAECGESTRITDGADQDRFVVTQSVDGGRWSLYANPKRSFRDDG